MAAAEGAKPVLSVTGSQPARVGDGFVIRRPMPGPELEQVNPFLVLDHAGPTVFPPTDTPRGVDEHPHRGFETVTIVYQGALEHRDSAGHHGMIGPGDVQWMTAGAGVVHEEKHERAFAKQGGTLEIIQLWVNLPAKDKNHRPRYQEIRADRIPTVAVPDGRGAVRVIAGAYGEVTGPAQTFTPVTMLDLHLKEGDTLTIPIPDSHHGLLYVLNGSVTVNGSSRVEEAEVAVFGTAGEHLAVRAGVDTVALLLAGEPIDEPVVSYGPFVMNTWDEIRQAMRDYQAGKMGSLKPETLTA